MNSQVAFMRGMMVSMCDERKERIEKALCELRQIVMETGDGGEDGMFALALLAAELSWDE